MIRFGDGRATGAGAAFHARGWGCRKMSDNWRNIAGAHPGTGRYSRRGLLPRAFGLSLNRLRILGPRPRSLVMQLVTPKGMMLLILAPPLEPWRVLSVRAPGETAA